MKYQRLALSLLSLSLSLSLSLLACSSDLATVNSVEPSSIQSEPKAIKKKILPLIQIKQAVSVKLEKPIKLSIHKIHTDGFEVNFKPPIDQRARYALYLNGKNIETKQSFHFIQDRPYYTFQFKGLKPDKEYKITIKTMTYDASGYQIKDSKMSEPEVVKTKSLKKQR